ncbi:hypothetical protein ACIQVT_04500 [Streptomyces sp. NPDC100445]|uniref:hypothetical protein n=1 Tax=Streptomyces sp. NPDC100445 TaxID=3366102 RepID=UPI0037F251D2
MGSFVRTLTVIAFALGVPGIGAGAATADSGSEHAPVIIQCNNPTSISVVDASGGDALLSQLISLLGTTVGANSPISGGPANSGGNAAVVGTGAGGEAGSTSSQSANNNRCGTSSDVDASTRIDNSRR